ncbi:hypothetical protein FSP39_011188 [Pinctada imbricata]|uniref:PLAT domain-containing protein n=1 Tax=Pinctada imbricata TaxID=66713 RepID=A0AA88XXP8_PINIB|nr:hypothetical protein FSP39_011188 [Pinctada imbricata]
MSSEAVIKCVAKKLKYYFDVKRLEDGFDLSGVNSPQLDHPPLKSRPTLQYDGLHDRALKHYFSLPEVKVKLTQMGPGQKENREFVVKKKLKTTMKRHNYLPSPLPDFAYTDTRQGRKLRKDMTGFGVPLRSFKHKSFKGGWPLLRSVPNHSISKVEAERLVNVATKLLVATQTVENLQPLPPERTRPQSAPKPFEVSYVMVGILLMTSSTIMDMERKYLNIYVIEDGDWAEYQIYVRTGNRIGASTKADVKLTLYGEKGKTKEFPLDKSKRHKVCFQKGKEDLFIIPCHHVGKLVKVKIGHDRTELSNAWFLEGVTVYDMRDKRIYEFVCERWLSGADGDRRTYRDLEVDRERAFIQALEEESTDEVYPSEHDGNSSTESAGRRKESVRGHGHSMASKSAKTNTRQRSRSRSDSGTEYDSDSSTSSSSSDSTTNYTTTTNTTMTATLPQREKDEFFDAPTKSGGPTYTFREIRTEGQEGKPADGQEFLHGYKAGLEAVQEEKRKQMDEENEERRKLLRGPTIHEAAERGDMARIQELLDNFPDMLENTDEHGYTPLHLASKNGKVEVVKWLTVQNVSLNKESPTGYTAIHLAAMSGHVNCLMVLAAMGAAITCRSTDKKTPLYLAAREGHMECVKWLVANRSRLDVKDDMGRTPRMVAEEFRHDEVAKFLRACEDEMNNPNSGFSQMRTGKGGRGGLSPIREDASSTGDEKTLWVDDKSSSLRAYAGSERSTTDSSPPSQREKEEKKTMYEEQHKKMEETGDTFLDAIRHELEGPGPQ